VGELFGSAAYLFARPSNVRLGSALVRGHFRSLVLILVLSAPASRAGAGCVNPAAWAGSTASITRFFDAGEPQAEPDVVGIRGTGWLLSPTAMVTVGHVATAMNLSSNGWKPIEIREAESRRSIPARIAAFAGAGPENIAVLELQSAFSNAPSFRVRTEPLVADEPVVSLAYPGGRARIATGRFVQYGEEKRYAGAALLELYDGNDRLVLDHGASGAPVLDCDGRVVAVVSELFEQTIQFISKPIRISTAWGMPNVVSVPARALKDFPGAD
jgi:hypothetical protein